MSPHVETGGRISYAGENDREVWLEILGQVCERFNWTVHAYCQMGNHYHLLIETPDGNLAKGMRQLNGVYTQRFNQAHNRVGHVFQGRYKAILVQKEAYLLELSRSVARPLRWYFRKHTDRNRAVCEAFRSGGYSMREIGGDRVGLHYSTISMIISRGEQEQKKP